MSLLEAIVLVLGLAAGLGFALAVAQVALEPGNGDRSVGPWRVAPRPPPPRPEVPSTYASLRRNEQSQWHGTSWEHLLERLAAYGDEDALVDAPAEFDPVWLDQRLTKLEHLNGPFPYRQGTESDAS